MDGKCKATAEYKGAVACGTSIKLVDSFMKLAPYFGAFLIIFGTFMVLFGSKFIFQVFGGLIGFGTSIVLFLFCYALFLPINAEIGFVAGVIAGCIILGGVIAYFSYRLTKTYIVQILGAIGGIVVFLMLVKVLKLKKKYWNFIFAVLGGVVGWFVAYKLRHFVKAAGTSLIGSFLFVRGVGCYAPGYPNEFNMNANEIVNNPNGNLEIILYMIGFIVLTVIGTFFQMKTQGVDEEDEDDAFKNQSEARVCGCF
jgi:hypothetical protein